MYVLDPSHLITTLESEQSKQELIEVHLFNIDVSVCVSRCLCVHVHTREPGVGVREGQVSAVCLASSGRGRAHPLFICIGSTPFMNPKDNKGTSIR